MSTHKAFMNGRSQAFRIPKHLAYARDDIEFTIDRVGDAVIIQPAEPRLDGLCTAFLAFGSKMRRPADIRFRRP